MTVLLLTTWTCCCCCCCWEPPQRQPQMKKPRVNNPQQGSPKRSTVSFRVSHTMKKNKSNAHPPRSLRGGSSDWSFVHSTLEALLGLSRRDAEALRSAKALAAARDLHMGIWAGSCSTTVDFPVIVAGLWLGGGKGK